MNLSFLTGEISSDAVRYESAKHVQSDLDDQDQEQLYADCQHSQYKAAEYLRKNIDCIREAFPDPETTPFKQRRYGGFVHVTGRRAATFAEILESLSPNPDRFDDKVSTPGLVSEGPEAKRAKQMFLTDAKIVL